MRATRSFTGAWRCEVPIRSFCLASFSRASGLTFEGPQPNRPSAGFHASGIFTIARVIELSALGSDAGLPSVAWGRVAARPWGWPGRGAIPKTSTWESYVPDQLRGGSRPRRPEPPDCILPLHRCDPVVDRCVDLRHRRPDRGGGRLVRDRVHGPLPGRYLRLQCRVSPHVLAHLQLPPPDVRRVAAIWRRRGARLPDPDRRTTRPRQVLPAEDPRH